MIDEAPMSDRTRLSPRAGIAVLSLQLRSTVQEAIEAEAAADAIDVDGALWQLRSRLTPLIDERRRALDDEVAAERDRGVEAIAAAHLEADRIVAAAVEAAAARAMAVRAAAELARRAEAAQHLWEPIARVAPAVEVEALVEPEALVVHAAPALFDQAEFWATDPIAPDVTAPDVVVAEPTLLPPPLPPELLQSPVLLEPALLPPPSTPMTLALPALGENAACAPSVWAPSLDPSGSQPIHVVLDADSFARAFAAAMAPILEARQQAAPQFLYPPAGYLPMQATPAKKKSFWANAWHPDVLLSGLAMVIVIIVLIAWTG